MADRVSASIVLGGTISTATLADLVKFIEQEGLTINWDGEPFCPRAIAQDQPLHLCAHDFAWGREKLVHR